MKKASSSTNIVDDLSSIFGGKFVCAIYFLWCKSCLNLLGSMLTWLFFVPSFLRFKASPSAGEFQEVEGESEERRKARLERHQRAQERAVCVLLYFAP